MDKPDLEAELHFSQPVRQVTLMLAVLVLSGAGAFLAMPRVLPVFQSNPYLNGFILIVFLFLAAANQIARPSLSRCDAQEHFFCLKLHF